ncbi:MAG: hypothetical protein IPM42_04460 [Saprospiraceae bacterium]|nr:hypothetical protein [Saprospiraceae bacterium]
MNDFYKQPIFLQWIEAILLLLAGFYSALLILELAYDHPIFYLLFLVFIPLMQFSTAPFFKLTGVYTYYSPMLLGYMANDIQIDLHSGVSFDYLLVMRKYKAGIEFRNRLLAYHLEGLLEIIRQIENSKIPGAVNIIGTSYFFNSRTLNKLGFELKNPSLSYRLNLFLNIIDLVWMYSVSQGRFSVPKIWDVKKASISGGKLLERKDVIEGLYKKMTLKINASDYYFHSDKSNKF